MSDQEQSAKALGSVGEIWRYPVKSLAGERLESVELGTGGLPGDRAWAVRDEVNGGIRGAKKLPGLMQLAARYASPPAPTGSSPAEIRLPDGSTLSTGDPDAAERISKAIDHAVTLWPLVSADTLDHYRRGAPTHNDFDTELRAIFGRTADEPLPDLSVFPPELLQYESPPGTYFDAFPLLLITDRSLASLQRAQPEARFDVRRFRPNFVIHTDDPTASTDADTLEPYPELAWADRRLRLGTATLRTTIACPRCVMTTHGFADLPKDPTIMRTLVREAGGSLGIYATVETPGTVQSGDALVAS